jgi:hypothetical protein
MVKSATDDETGTAPDLRPTRKPVRSKIIAVGSIPASDSDFLAWQGVHCPRLGTRDAMLLYVKDLNGQNKIRFEQEMEQWKTYMRSRLPPHQRKHLEDLMANRDELTASVSELKALSETLGQTIILATHNISEQKALNETLSQTIILTPQNTSQDILPSSRAQFPEHFSSPRTVFSPEPFRTSLSGTAPIPEHSPA